MKVVLLAGGFGTRISEESHLKPKPMLEIGGHPILWHIMKGYSHYGYNEFIVCAGYKQHIIKEYFANYYLHNTDVTFDLQSNSMTVHRNYAEPWKVTVVDTGLNTMTGGRLKRVQSYLQDESFMLTYGDGVSDVDINALVKYHQEHNCIATMTSVQPEGRFGVLNIEKDHIKAFREKSKTDVNFINGGFMVLNPQIFNYLQDDDTILERYPLETIAQENQLMAYKHYGFWQCMDTKRDMEKLNEYWESGKAPWKVWVE